jgi:hypothetical protein
MHNALSVVDQVMYLAFKDRFKIILHLTSSHFNANRHRQPGIGGDIIYLRTDDLYFTIFNFIHSAGSDPFYHGSPATTALKIDILSPDTLAFKGGAIGYRYRDIGNINF